jgi:hypothetical protein
MLHNPAVYPGLKSMLPTWENVEVEIDHTASVAISDGKWYERSKETLSAAGVVSARAKESNSSRLVAVETRDGSN